MDDARKRHFCDENTTDSHTDSCKVRQNEIAGSTRAASKRRRSNHGIVAASSPTSPNNAHEYGSDRLTVHVNAVMARSYQRVGLRLTSSFFQQPCCSLAQSLLGKLLVRLSDDTGLRVSGVIVETEAYLGVEDRASHSYGGRRTARNEAMFMAAGTAYVYNIYGIYTCINISSEEDGAAVLIRALDPVEGLDIMQSARGKSAKMKVQALCNGPSKLTKALGIVKANSDQVDLSTCTHLWLEDGESVPDTDIVSCSRIGIGNYAEEWTEKPLRFYIRNNRSISVRNKAAESS